MVGHCCSLDIFAVPFLVFPFLKTVSRHVLCFLAFLVFQAVLVAREGYIGMHGKFIRIFDIQVDFLCKGTV